MAEELMAAIDAGTTGVRCVLFNMQGRAVAHGYYETPTLYPKPGLVEQSASDVVELAFRAVRAAISYGNIDSSNIVGLCITHQRNTWVPVDRYGNFLTNMFVWQDQRGSVILPWIREQLARAGLELAYFYELTGQTFGSVQAGVKTFWYRLYMPERYRRTYKLLTPQAFLLHAFGVRGYIDERDDISNWLIANGSTFEYDERLLAVFGMDKDKYPDCAMPGSLAGKVSRTASRRSGLLAGTPIYVGSGDQQCGALAVGNLPGAGIASVCLGTAGLCIASSAEVSRHPRGKCQVQGHPAGGFTIEGHSSSCMSSFRWLENLLATDNISQAIRAGKNPYLVISDFASQSSAGAGGVVFLPWLQGAACPHFADEARGALIGMTLATTRADMLRAAIEGICFEMRQMMDTLWEANIEKPDRMRVLGGPSKDRFWCQIQADIYGLPVEVMAVDEATALGAAMIGFAGAGGFTDLYEAVLAMSHIGKYYEPDQKQRDIYDRLYTAWQECYIGLARRGYKDVYDFQQEARHEV